MPPSPQRPPSWEHWRVHPPPPNPATSCSALIHLHQLPSPARPAVLLWGRNLCGGDLRARAPAGPGEGGEGIRPFATAPALRSLPQRTVLPLEAGRRWRMWGGGRGRLGAAYTAATLIVLPKAPLSHNLCAELPASWSRTCDEEALLPYSGSNSCLREWEPVLTRERVLRDKREPFLKPRERTWVSIKHP